ncbi:MAG: hypothetical protein LCH54_03825 [Bacteroidetes bacterium]|nr:hypothetical protein [Bacteroidota bacterium]
MYFTIQNLSISSQKVNTPKLRVQFNLNCEKGDQKNTTLIMVIAKLTLEGDIISSVETQLTSEKIDRSINLREITFTLSNENLKIIERKRSDDLTLNMILEFLVTYQIDVKEKIELVYENANIHQQIKFSQKEWVNNLTVFGYYDAWLIEVAKPKLEGFDLVRKHLEEAKVNLLQSDYGGCVSSLRISWNSIKPFVDARWNEISGLLDDGSPGESGKDSKSVRIKKLKDNIHALSQIGAHQEFYKVNPEDAWLIYYGTVAMIAFLSKLISRLPEEN